jgi:hypothetical protein
VIGVILSGAIAVIRYMTFAAVDAPEREITIIPARISAQRVIVR